MGWGTILEIVAIALALPNACESVLHLVHKGTARWQHLAAGRKNRKTMHLTQEETFTELQGSGRKSWTLRQMTALREEGYLPPLQRRTRPGTNKPLFVWSEKDIEQVVEVYDCWEHCAGDRVTLTLMLWLLGYEVPLDRLRHFYERTVEEYLQRLTHGKTDMDDILDEVSRVMIPFVRKLRYTPGLAAQRKKNDVKQMAGVTEAILGALAISDPEGTTEILSSFLANADTNGVLEKLADNEEFFEESLGAPQRITALLHDVLTLSNLHEAIQMAAHDQWEQAREDYLRLCQLFSELGEFLASLGCPPWPEFPEEFYTNWILQGAIWLTVPFLSARHRGYGQELDMAFEKIHEFLTDSAIRTELLKGMEGSEDEDL